MIQVLVSNQCASVVLVEPVQLWLGMPGHVAEDRHTLAH